jgi:hypothetical protein
MPYLGDYLGHLLSEITMARMQADLEAVRVAELYADHPLLRYMPVPRFRMPDVDLDVPIVIKEVEESQAGESTHGTPAVAEMRKAFDKALTSAVTVERVPLDPAMKKKLKTALDRKALNLSRPSEIAFNMNRVASEFTKIALQATAGMVQADQQAMFEEGLKDAVRLEFIKLRKPQLRLNALVTTSEIKEAGPADVITRLHLKITEEAFEWTSIESDKGKEDRLVIE